MSEAKPQVHATDPVASASTSAGLRSYLWLLPPVAAGLFLRVYNLLGQVAAGDELHTVRALIQLTLREIPFTYRGSDNCLPLTFLYKLLSESGVLLNELLLRLPILLSAALLLVLAPLWAARRLGREPAIVLAWLLSISYVLVFYGRIVRSYMPVVLLGFLAAAAFEAWLRRPTWGRGLLYSLAGALAVYFHPGAGPFVAAPFFLWLVLWLMRRPVPSWRAAALLGLGLSAGILAFLVPSWSSLQALVDSKQGESYLSWGTLRGYAALQAGTKVFWLQLLFWGGAALGLVRLIRHQPRLAALLATLQVGQVAGMWILSPLAMHQAPIFGRYMLITLPWILVLLAYGVAAPWTASGERSAGRWPWLRRGLAASLILALFAFGPMLEARYREGSFVHQAESLIFYQPRQRASAQLPAIYREMESGPEGAVLEYPWCTTWRWSRIIPHYQRQHGRPVRAVVGERVFWDQRLQFRNMLRPQPDELLDSGAAFLVVHLDLEAEEDALDQRRRLRPGPDRQRDLGRRERVLAGLSRQARNRSWLFAQQWGPPDHATEQHQIWNLQRIRQRGAADSPAP